MKTRKVRITKVRDIAFDNDHPNSINEGYTKVGNMILNSLEVGHSLILLNEFGTISFRTSVIEDVINDKFFKTMNSFYKIEYLDGL